VWRRPRRCIARTSVSVERLPRAQIHPDNLWALRGACSTASNRRGERPQRRAIIRQRVEFAGRARRPMCRCRCPAFCAGSLAGLNIAGQSNMENSSCLAQSLPLAQGEGEHQGRSFDADALAASIHWHDDGTFASMCYKTCQPASLVDRRDGFAETRPHCLPTNWARGCQRFFPAYVRRRRTADGGPCLDEAARLIIERLSTSDAPVFMDAEHTALVTLVAQDLLRGASPDAKPLPRLTGCISSSRPLTHDLGYMRGVCPGGRRRTADLSMRPANTVVPAARCLGRVTWRRTTCPGRRSRCESRFASHAMIDGERIAQAIELTPLSPCQTTADHEETDTEGRPGFAPPI